MDFFSRKSIKTVKKNPFNGFFFAENPLIFQKKSTKNNFILVKIYPKIYENYFNLYNISFIIEVKIF